MEFWREMYESATATRQREHKRAMWYKQQAREAERKRRIWKNAVIGTLLTLASVACVASWAAMIAG